MHQSETFLRLATLSSGRDGMEAGRSVAAPLPSGWVCLRDCNISGMLNRPVQIHYVLLHPEMGVALLDIAPAMTADAEAILRRRLEAVRFQGIFQGYLPIVHCRILPREASAIAGILRDAFAALPPLTLAGGNAWVTVVRRTLSPRDPARAAAPSGVPGPQPGWQAQRAEPPADRPPDEPTHRPMPKAVAPPPAPPPDLPQEVHDSDAAAPALPPQPAARRPRSWGWVAAGLGTAIAISGLAAVMGGDSRPTPAVEATPPVPAVTPMAASPEPAPSLPAPIPGTAGMASIAPRLVETQPSPGAPPRGEAPPPAPQPAAQEPVQAPPVAAVPLPPGPMPEPPVPTPERQSLAAASTPPPESAGAGQDAAPRVVVASPANLRTGPSNSSSVLRVTRRGEDFRVLGRAPGGWIQVGDPQPVGWIHSSLLKDVAP